MNIEKLLKGEYDLAILYIRNAPPVCIDNLTPVTHDSNHHTIEIVDDDAMNPAKAMATDPARVHLTKTILIADISCIDYIRMKKIITKNSKIIH